MGGGVIIIIKREGNRKKFKNLYNQMIKKNEIIKLPKKSDDLMLQNNACMYSVICVAKSTGSIARRSAWNP